MIPESAGGMVRTGMPSLSWLSGSFAANFAHGETASQSMKWRASQPPHGLVIGMRSRGLSKLWLFRPTPGPKVFAASSAWPPAVFEPRWPCSCHGESLALRKQILWRGSARDMHLAVWSSGMILA